MKRLLLLAVLSAPAAFAEKSLEDASKFLCKDHPTEVQCEQLVYSIAVHAYVIGQTQVGCELGIVEACTASTKSPHFNTNVKWFEEKLKNP